MNEDLSRESDGVSEEVATLADQLYLSVVHLLRRVRRADESLDLSSAQLSAITRLVAKGPMTVGDLARAEGVRPPTMTRLIQRLEQSGYVIRRSDPDDARVQRIAYTSRAHMALEAGRAGRVAAFGARLEALSTSERRRLKDALDILDSLSREPEVKD